MTSATSGEITIESNHESSDQLQASLDLSDSAPPDPTPESQETVSPEKESDTSDPVTAAADPLPEEASDSTLPQKTAKQRRRKDATAAVQVAIGKQREAERRAADAEARLAALTTDTAAPKASTPAPPKADWARYQEMPGAPQVEEFDKYEDYTTAVATFVTDLRHQELATQEAYAASQAAEQESERARQSVWQERLETARKSDPTFDDHLNADTPMSLPMQHLTMESPVGTQLLQYLSTHQDESQRLSTLHPVEVYREMGKLEERLSAASSERGSAPVISHAKPPIKPLGSSPHTPDADAITDELSFDEHFRRMNASDRKHGRL
jgi:hypothetical protein|tara:strand:- start:499 stop:1473 length:975 start_codon:yes stop_codon:yes gene_type:complete